MEPHDLPALLASRICHDLVSPVGAVENGLDLLAEIAPPGVEDEIALVRQSSVRSADLLKLYRIAFGAADAGSTVPLATLHAQADAVVAGPRTEWHWVGMESGEVPRPAARLAAVLILAARAATLLGGRVTVAADAEGMFRITVESERLSLSETQHALLAGRTPEDAAGSREVEFALLGPWAEAAGYRVQASRGAGGLRIEARPAAQGGATAGLAGTTAS